MSPNLQRGRPRDPQKQEEQKLKLIEAARSLLQEKSYKSITIRDIGAAAELNSAMVKYYFGSKEGLFIATINQMSKQVLTFAQQAIQVEQPVKLFIEFITVTLARDPGFARFIHDEVLAESSPLREAFFKGHASKVSELLPALVEIELKHHGLAPRVNTRYAAFNLMSMIMMPFLAAPIRKGVWNITDEEIADSAWVEHLYQQFIAGCAQEI